MGIRIYSNSFSNPEYYSYSYSLKVDSTNNIRIRIRVKIIIRDNTDPDQVGPFLFTHVGRRGRVQTTERCHCRENIWHGRTPR